jgi:hypothetical protein
VILTPTVTQLWDIPVPPKRRAVVMTRANCASLRVQLVDANGDALDLSTYVPETYTFTVALGEYVSRDQGNRYIVTGEIESPATAGWCSATVPTEVAIKPGIYLAQAAITDDTSYPRCAVEGEVVQTITATATETTIRTLRPDTSTHDYVYPAGSEVIVGLEATLQLKQQLVRNVCVVISNILYVSVERGLLGVGGSGAPPGPPSMAEVRLELRDYPEVNRLLDNYEFDEAEILHAALRCVDYFNEVPPELDQRFDSSNFTWRYHWMEGIVYHLLQVAISWLDRNKLNYSAGGVQVDDLGRSGPYIAHMQMRKQKWEEWVKRTKTRLNAESGFLSLGSEYNQSGW